MRARMLLLTLAVTLSLPAANSAQAAGKRAWLTISDAALRHAASVVPDIVPITTRQLHSDNRTENVHVVTIKEGDVLAVSGAVHQRLQQCGGFMYHASEAEALSALNLQPFSGPRPAYTVDSVDVVRPILASMQEKNVEATIQSLSGFVNRYYMSQSGEDASGWLLRHWSELAKGRDDISVSQYKHAKYRQPSVMLTIKGVGNPEEELVVGAHLDSILLSRMSEKAVAPGADDDASGVASMTEALRAMVEHGYRPRRTIHLVAYAAEEVGLRGSQEIARAFKERGSKVVGVLQLDMTNYKGAANDIYLFTDYTDKTQNEFLARLIATYLPELKVGYDRCGYACSDHASWTAQGFPASMPFESTLGRDNPHIHTARDTYANSGNQAAHALKFARLAAAYMVELSGQ